jgi:hypothetical protein
MTDIDPPWDAVLTTDLTLSEKQIAALRDEWARRPGAEAMTPRCPHYAEAVHPDYCVFCREEKLRAEVERLTADADHHLRAYQIMFNDNERLRAALQAIEHETGMTMLATNHGRRGDLANTIARAALEPKP